MTKLKVGDIVRCIDSGFVYITPNKLYEIVEVKKNKVHIINDFSRIDWFHYHSFEYDVIANRNKTIDEIFK